MNTEQTLRHLRYMIDGQLHIGRLKGGDPLPSIRTVAKETGADHRAVAGAYRVLEAEGIVEIRPGAGVYLRRGVEERAAREGEAGWLAEVLLAGWERGLSRGQAAARVHAAGMAPVRCVCVESNDDHMAAAAAELEGELSLEVVQALVSPSAAPDAVPRHLLADADLVVTSAFHAEAARAAAERAGVPCVVLRVNPAFAAEIGRRLQGHEVTAVIADPRYGTRARAYLDVTGHRDRTRYVLADEVDDRLARALAEGAPGVLATRAARRRLGLPEYHLLPPPPSYLSPESVRAILEVVVRLATDPG